MRATEPSDHVIQPPDRNFGAAGRLIGYARVSTDEQAPIPSSMSGARRAAPRCSKSTPPAPTAAVRSWRTCCATSAAARPWSWSGWIASHAWSATSWPSLNSSKRTAAFPQPARSHRHHHAAGHVLAAGAGRRRQLERALIAERTKARPAGRAQAWSRRRQSRLRARDPDAIRKVRSSRDAAHLEGILAQLDAWLPTVRRMRPDQHGEGRDVAIWANPEEAGFCPLDALDAWLAHRRTAPDLDWTASAPSRAERPLFCAVSKTGRVTGRALSDKAVARLVKQAALDAGLDPERYSGHSLRAGLATAGDQGAGLAELMRQTRHKSTEVALGYLRPADLWRNNVTEKVFGQTR